MTEFKFAKECSEKGIEFKGCKEFKVELCLTKEIRDVNCFWIEAYENKENINVYPNPSEEELSKRLPDFIEEDNELYIKNIYYSVSDKEYFLDYVDINFENGLLRRTGKTTKECYQKALLKLNDMELLK